MTENLTTSKAPNNRSATADNTCVLMARAFTALRIFTGLVWLSNALAKISGVAFYDWGLFSFNLITVNAARGIATDASAKTIVTPLKSVYQDFVLPNWAFFGHFLTIAELAIGLGLIFGLASRLAALGGLLLLTPIWVMLWHRGGYLWEYPAEDLFPLVLLAIVPTGRVLGLDRVVISRFGQRWPF